MSKIEPEHRIIEQTDSYKREGCRLGLVERR